MVVDGETMGPRQLEASRPRAEILLEAQNRILRLIARGDPLDGILHELIGFMERRSEEAICSILLRDEQANVLRYSAAPSLPEPVRRAYAVVAIGPRVGSCGTAAYRRERVVVEDIATDPLWMAYKDIALAHGLRACTSTPIFSSRGEVLGAFAFYYTRPTIPGVEDLELIDMSQDIAGIAIESQAQRQALVELNADLELRVQERTQELESFAYSVSHDLRAPLRSIDGRLGMLEEDSGESLDAQARDHIQAARRSALYMSRLIDDLLTFSRSSVKPMNKIQLQPAELVREAFSSLSDLTQGRDIELEIGTLPACRADRALLLQVFVNLLSNAVKYSRVRPKTRIRVQARETPDTWTCSVEDNGIGFEMRHAELIFGVFQRLHSQTEYEGSGIGLALVKRIVQRHGGRVWAVSTPGLGSTFSMALPR